MRRYDGPTNDPDLAYAVAASPDGAKVFVTGASFGLLGQGRDYATVAYDALTGNELWVRRYSGPGPSEEEADDEAHALAVSPDGAAVYVTGYSHGLYSDLDYLTVAYDTATGQRRWLRRYNGPGNTGDFAQAIALSSDGTRVFVTGYDFGNGTWADYSTLAYDATTGHKLWLSRYDGASSGFDHAVALAASPDGTKVFVTGYSDGPALGISDYATLAYDATTGQEIWLRRYDGPANDTDSAQAIAVNPNGMRVYVTGLSKYEDMPAAAERDLEKAFREILHHYKVFYGFDSVGRLIDANKKANDDGSGNQINEYQYVYDVNGNKITDRYIVPGQSTVTTNYFYNGANELCWKSSLTGSLCSSPPVDPSTVTFAYDANGNLCVKNDGSTVVDCSSTGPTINKFTYNAKDQTTSITPAGQSAVTLAYLDVDQWDRIHHGSDTLISDQLGVASRTASGSQPTYYTRALDGTVLGERVWNSSTSSYDNYYFLFDDIGSVILVTNPDGTENGHYSYTPYGDATEDTVTVENPRRYAGGYYDGAFIGRDKLYKFGERYYDPGVGRWTQQDPFDFPLATVGWNGYNYAQCDPINQTDPAGLLPSCAHFVARGKSGYVAIQTVPGGFLERGSIHWGVYMYSVLADPGPWVVQVLINNKPVDFKSQLYPPHGSIKPAFAPSGSTLIIWGYHLGLGQWHTIYAECRVP